MLKNLKKNHSFNYNKMKIFQFIFNICDNSIILFIQNKKKKSFLI